MRIFIDTNILFSTVLNPDSTPAKAYFKAVTYPNNGIICEQNTDELRRTFNRKFPNKMSSLEKFLSFALLSLEVVAIPEQEVNAENCIRDVMDRPIFRSAVSAGADIILTGDKDFLESGITNPRIMTASEFLNI